MFNLEFEHIECIYKMTRSCVKERTDVMYFHYCQIYETLFRFKVVTES